jgi:GNAT superfamily N-acetyltransferase
LVSARYRGPAPLTAEHDLRGLLGGAAALAQWLRRYALVNQASGSARTYLVTPAVGGRVGGYDAIASGAVAPTQTTAPVAKTMPQPVAVLLLGRLAVDQGEHGRGLGASLVQDAIVRTLHVADQVGVRALLAHAANKQAAALYARFDLEPSPTDPLHMLLLRNDAHTSLRQADRN